MKKLFLYIILAFCIILTSCHKDVVTPFSDRIIELDEKSAQLIKADNKFGIDLIQQVRENSNEDNIMISPLSISTALAMVYNGADSDTKTEMENMLYLNGLSMEDINTSYQTLIQALQSLDSDVVFELANAIFYKDGFDVKQNFLDINKNYYDAEVKSLDFDAPASLELINDWVANKTHDKILKIIESLNSDDRMVLLNAIYFNGMWATQFDKEGTKLRDFFTLDGGSYETPMMSKTDSIEYSSNHLFKAVKMPYGNGQYNMMVFLPNNEISSTDLLTELNDDSWNQWMQDFELKNDVVVTMPRFKFEFEQGLVDILKQLGMQKAFQPFVADFSKIADQDLFVSSVIHKTFIDVNETGTEAAAVTAIKISVTSIMPGEELKTYFTVNKPFLFAITEKDTEAILFIGEVRKPEYPD